MRSSGKDIVEMFGFAPDDTTAESISFFKDRQCPFVPGACTKTNHDRSETYGTCAVTLGSAEVIICPKRLYANNYEPFQHVKSKIWGDAIPLIVGGTTDDLRRKALKHQECVVAFGQNSGSEVTINSNGKLSIDWILQRYRNTSGRLVPIDFAALEVQSIDITGNYRENFTAYKNLRDGSRVNYIPPAGHGLNWANVHKRLIPQIIRKGNVYHHMSRCIAFVFVLPKIVYEKFDEILGDVEEESNHSKDNLTVFTYSLGGNVPAGKIRGLVLNEVKHHSLANIVFAFSSNTEDGAPAALESKLKSLLY
ncbi:NotI family restriction endonuclease [Rhodovulum strictum]|uniref:Restriction endonuclease n=1 Tax=Rhodovulum strictum TaxID=58314 RepID=A0A844BHB5_9RHOB|nr:NotI family restriction endonuclease [Rhodovulum strictum]MRH21888.1 restriction endonuclease [Rhodovulum strictum]